MQLWERYETICIERRWRWSFSLLSVDWSKWQAFAWRSFNGTAELEPPLPKWCGCTSLFLFNGAIAPFSTLSMVRLDILHPSGYHLLPSRPCAAFQKKSKRPAHPMIKKMLLFSIRWWQKKYFSIRSSPKKSPFLLSRHSDGRPRRKAPFLWSFSSLLECKNIFFLSWCSCPSLQRILSSSMVTLTLPIWKKSLTGLEKNP